MGTVRVALDCSRPRVRNVKGIIFPRAGRKSAPANIPTAMHPTRDCLAVPRFPCVESLLGPCGEIHETWVTFEAAEGTRYRFLVLARYLPDGQVNQSLHTVLPEVDWKGDLVVMRSGSILSVVNMGKPVDYQRAQQAVRKFLVKTAPIINNAVAHNLPIVIPTAI